MDTAAPMDGPAPTQRYRQLAAAFTAAVSAVPSESWTNPSPCAEWTAVEVLRHVVNAERDAVRPAQLELSDGPSVEDEPLRAWADTRDKIQAVLDNPKQAELSFDGFFGPTTLGQSIEDYYCFDLILHRWDIARATGGDTSISAEEITFVRAKLELYGDAMRMPGVFGPELDPPADADEQTALLAFIGRLA